MWFVVEGFACWEAGDDESFRIVSTINIADAPQYLSLSNNWNCISNAKSLTRITLWSAHLRCIRKQASRYTMFYNAQISLRLREGKRLIFNVRAIVPMILIDRDYFSLVSMILHYYNNKYRRKYKPSYINKVMPYI